MTVRRFFSTDASAPVIDGTAGSALNVLDACLVNGYGSRVAAGWSIAFSGTNTRAYRSASPGGSPSEGTQFYLRVDDTGTTTATARGYESMSNIDAGSEPFPTVAQVASGSVIRKSSTADAVPRPWGLVANEKFFILIVQTNSAQPGEMNAADCSFLFGDFTSYLSGDVYNAIIVGSTTSGTAQDSFLAIAGLASFSGSPGCYMARDYTSVAGAVAFGTTSKRANSGSRSGGGFLPASAPPYGSLVIDPVYVYEMVVSATRSVCRGVINGIWSINNVVDGIQLRTFDRIEVTSGQLIGRTLMYVRTNATGFFVEISDTW